MKKNKLIVVAGGAGFIGFHLCSALILEYQCDVLCIDNLSTGKVDNLVKITTLAKEQEKEFHFLQKDVEDENLFNTVKEYVNKNFPLQKIDAYINLACPASPVAYQAVPMKTLNTCYLGTKHAMDFASYGIKVLHASTSEIYGDPEEHPQKESYKGSVNTWGPRACYDEGKRVAETICYEYANSWNFDVRVVRIFNSYGPRMQKDDGRVLTNFIGQALSNQPITVYGDGSQTRSMCYVTDTVDGILKILFSEKSIKNPVNVGNPEEISMKDLAKKVLEIISTSLSKIEYVDLPADDPKLRCPDIALAKEIGWQPKISLKEGLQLMIEDFRHRFVEKQS